MATSVRVKLETDGFRQLATSSEMESLVGSLAKGIADRAGGESAGFTSSTYTGGYGGGRVIGSAWTSTAEAMADEAENKTLTKAVTG